MSWWPNGLNKKLGPRWQSNLYENLQQLWSSPMDCKVTKELHPEGGSDASVNWVAPQYRWQEVCQQSPHPSLEARGCKGGRWTASRADKRATTPTGTQLSATEHSRTEQLVCWQCGGCHVISKENETELDKDLMRSLTRTWKQETAWGGRAPASSPSSPHFILSKLIKRSNNSLTAKEWIWDKPSLMTTDIRASMIIFRYDTTTGFPETKSSQQYVLQTASGETPPSWRRRQ